MMRYLIPGCGTMLSKKVIAIVQARMGSVRLPGKVLKKIEDFYVLELILKRLMLCQTLTKIVVATSDNDEDDAIVKFCDNFGVSYVRGDEFDVLKRFCLATKLHSSDYIVRITADCPFVSPDLVDKAVNVAVTRNLTYVSNSNPPTFPDGLDVEVVKTSALQLAEKEAVSKYEREHVTPWVKKHFFIESSNITSKVDYSNIRLTLDEESDLVAIRDFFSVFSPNYRFSWADMEEAIKTKRINLHFTSEKRNEGANMSSGQKLYRRAKQIIPGGNMLLSKRPEMFLPEIWPSYFSKAKGIKVWDMDGNEFLDMSIMGIGTNLLGYGNDEVDNAVNEAISRGNMCTLNAPEEVFLAEKLIKLHPWADMVRFARTGGEANAIAARIARAASKRDKIAICGYHGWHDWYLSVNLESGTNLDGHLLPGLEPNGVPQALQNTVYPFKYGDLDFLEGLLKKENIGTVYMEVARSNEPDINFLRSVRALCDRYEAILVFDECTSGFRQTFGGLHLETGVEPDIAMFGKALGNGYAITAVLGRKEIMTNAQTTFISSTFWTERIGSVAGLKTLEVMEKTQSWMQVTSMGRQIKKRWKELANNTGVDINIFGLDSLAGFNFASPQALIYKTFITQEMLKAGYLASNLVYVSTAHNQLEIDGYFNVLTPIFEKIAESKSSNNIEELLDGEICHSGFKRLT